MLHQRLLERDDAGNVLLEIARSSKRDIAPFATVVLGVLLPNLLEPLLDTAGRLIGG